MRNRIPEYVNFIKIRENKLNNNIKSNGKSVENILNNNNNNKSKNKINQKKEKENYINDNKFIFCSSVRNFNNYYCFNKKHQRDCENCATKEKTGNKSISKRNCDNEKNIRKEPQIKSNGKKYDNILKEKNQREQGCNSHRSYLNIYEKDRLLKKQKEKEKIKNVKNIKQNEIITIYKNNRKKCESAYKRVLFKKID